MTKHRSKYPKIAISKTMLYDFMDESGNINKTQAAIMRLPWPVPQDWKERVIGLKISYPKRAILRKLNGR